MNNCVPKNLETEAVHGWHNKSYVFPVGKLLMGANAMKKTIAFGTMTN